VEEPSKKKKRGNGGGKTIYKVLSPPHIQGEQGTVVKGRVDTGTDSWIVIRKAPKMKRDRQRGIASFRTGKAKKIPGKRHS